MRPAQIPIFMVTRWYLSPYYSLLFANRSLRIFRHNSGFHCSRWSPELGCSNNFLNGIESTRIRANIPNLEEESHDYIDILFTHTLYFATEWLVISVQCIQNLSSRWMREDKIISERRWFPGFPPVRWLFSVLQSTAQPSCSAGLKLESLKCLCGIQSTHNKKKTSPQTIPPKNVTSDITFHIPHSRGIQHLDSRQCLGFSCMQ